MTRRGPFRFESPDESPGFLLWKTTNRWQRHLRGALREVDLTHVQFVLLAGLQWLEDDGEPITQSALAGHLATDEMMTSSVLRTLEQKGFIERNPHPTDTRARSLSLTRSGKKIIATAVKLIEDADATFFDLGREDLRHLLRILQRLAKD